MSTATQVRRPVNATGRHARRTYLWMVIPSVVMLILINGYPTIYAGIQSLRDGSLLDAGDFVGMGNYGSVLTSDRFWSAARFTLIFTVVGVFGSWAVGLGLALLLRMNRWGSAFFKLMLLLPWVVPVVVSATAWNWLVATPDSPVPRLVGLFGGTPPLFLADPALAALTVCVFKVWASFPFMMMMSSAALTSVDPSVYEAADMDGASKWQKFVSITFPMTAKTTYISWIMMTIFCVNDFPTIYLLTGGGPVDATTSLVVLAYRTVFGDMQTGPGVAIAFLTTLVLIVVALAVFRRVRKVDF